MEFTRSLDPLQTPHTSFFRQEHGMIVRDGHCVLGLVDAFDVDPLFV